MAVITISRGVCSCGETLAERVAELLGARCLGREELTQRAAASGVPESELQDVLLKSPGLLERLWPRKRQYLALIRAALAEEAVEGNLVYHGNAGHLLLQGAGSLLRVRIAAPVEMRMSIAQERMGLSVQESAAFIARSDAERRDWARFLYDVEWSDPSLYDLVVNLKDTQMEDACDAIISAARLESFAWTSERRAQMKDFALTSRIRAALALDRGTAQLDLEVSSRSGIVEIRGFVGSQRGIREVERVAGGAPGVRYLDLDELVVYHDV